MTNSLDHNGEAKQVELHGSVALHADHEPETRSERRKVPRRVASVRQEEAVRLAAEHETIRGCLVSAERLSNASSSSRVSEKAKIPRLSTKTARGAYGKSWEHQEAPA